MATNIPSLEVILAYTLNQLKPPKIDIEETIQVKPLQARHLCIPYLRSS